MVPYTGASGRLQTIPQTSCDCNVERAGTPKRQQSGKDPQSYRKHIDPGQIDSERLGNPYGNTATARKKLEFPKLLSQRKLNRIVYLGTETGPA